MTELSINYLPTSSLVPRLRNPRTHSRVQIRQIADSIILFGFTSPILVDDASAIIAGHGRWQAAKLLKLERVPTIQLAELSPDQIKAYVIADNRLALNAGWDADMLRIEFAELADLNLDFELEITGFSTGEIDLLLQADPAGQVEAPLPPPRPGAPVSRRGDLWRLGRHLVLCGDATAAADYDYLMVGEQAQMIFTDPPYNVPINGHVSGLGKIQHDEFAMASGEMTEAAFKSFLTTVCQNLAANSIDGSLHYIFMDWRHVMELMTAGRAVYSDLKNICVWNKTNGGMGSFYRSKHELAFVYKAGTAPHINNVELGKHGRYRTNVWDYAGVSSLGAGRDEALAMHPTVKPVSLVADAILDATKRGDLILDPFGGSGTTLMAAEQTGRTAYLMEIEPKYVDTIVARYQAATGEAAYHADSGLAFDEVAAARDIQGASHAA